MELLPSSSELSGLIQGSCTDRIVEAVGQALTQLQFINAEDFEAQWPEVQRSMQEAGASAQDWREELLCCPHEARLAITAAQATRAEDRQFMITCGELRARSCI
jgi:hypothetical protein